MRLAPLFFLVGALIVCFPQAAAQFIAFVALWRIWVAGRKRQAAAAITATARLSGRGDDNELHRHLLGEPHMAVRPVETDSGLARPVGTNDQNDWSSCFGLRYRIRIAPIRG